MQGDIAVGVCQQPLLIGNAHAANNNRASAAKGVYVKTVSNAHYAFS
jgi:hypothetical protein